MKQESEPKTEIIAETEQYLAWKAEEPDNEITYHLELNNVTVHFFDEEWTEFLDLVKGVEMSVDEDTMYELEFNNLLINFTDEEWAEFLELVRLLMAK